MHRLPLETVGRSGADSRNELARRSFSLMFTGAKLARLLVAGFSDPTCKSAACASSKEAPSLCQSCEAAMARASARCSLTLTICRLGRDMSFYLLSIFHRNEAQAKKLRRGGTNCLDHGMMDVTRARRACAVSIPCGSDKVEISDV